MGNNVTKIKTKRGIFDLNEIVYLDIEYRNWQKVKIEKIIGPKFLLVKNSEGSTWTVMSNRISRNRDSLIKTILDLTDVESIEILEDTGDILTCKAILRGSIQIERLKIILNKDRLFQMHFKEVKNNNWIKNTKWSKKDENKK